MVGAHHPVDFLLCVFLDSVATGGQSVTTCPIYLALHCLGAPTLSRDEAHSSTCSLRKSDASGDGAYRGMRGQGLQTPNSVWILQ